MNIAGNILTIAAPSSGRVDKLHQSERRVSSTREGKDANMLIYALFETCKTTGRTSTPFVLQNLSLLMETMVSIVLCRVHNLLTHTLMTCLLGVLNTS